MRHLLVISFVLVFTVGISQLNKLGARGQTGILLIHNHDLKKPIIAVLHGMEANPCYLVLPRMKVPHGEQTPQSNILAFDSRDRDPSGLVQLYDVSAFGTNNANEALRHCTYEGTKAKPLLEKIVQITPDTPNIVLDYPDLV